MNARLVAAPLLTAALLLGAGHNLPATAGATTKTYTDSAHGLSFRYPASWRAQLHGKNTGYSATLVKTSSTFFAPDGSAAMVAMVGDKKLAGAALKSVALKLYKDGETASGPITAGQATIGNISFYSWSGKVKGSSGTVVLQTVYAGRGSAGTYYLGTAILAHPAASARTLQGILDSVTIQ